MVYHSRMNESVFGVITYPLKRDSDILAQEFAFRFPF